jgi:hypothetical protein
MIGGASDDKIGRAAIIISDRFTRGHSSPCVTFNSSILCGDTNDEKYREDDKFTFSQAETSKGNFVVVEMEIWGFEPENRVEFF